VQAGIRAVKPADRRGLQPELVHGRDLRLEGAIGKDPDDAKLPELRATPSSTSGTGSTWTTPSAITRPMRRALRSGSCSRSW
jgi:hypothetical protein